jgi:ribonuclease P protein component
VDKPDHSFPKSIRLLRQFQFDQVHASQYFAADDTLVIKAVGTDSGPTRLGLSVSRKVGNAVVRNRWKRLIREAFRQQKSELPAGLDIVVRPRKGAICQYHEVFQSLKILTGHLARRIRKPSVRK